MTGLRCHLVRSARECLRLPAGIVSEPIPSEAEHFPGDKYRIHSLHSGNFSVSGSSKLGRPNPLCATEST